MGDIVSPRHVKLIAGIITSSAGLFAEAEEMLQKTFGQIDYRSRILEFDFTRYYEKDMGRDLKRRFVAFGRLVDPATLARLKILTNKIERRLSRIYRGVNRPVNIDPGYITDAKLVLASTKDYGHRIYLSKGIYAEITLSYRKGSFRSLDWTYPDYKSQNYISIFNEIRHIYKEQIRQVSALKRQRH